MKNLKLFLIGLATITIISCGGDKKIESSTESNSAEASSGSAESESTSSGDYDPKRGLGKYDESNVDVSKFDATMAAGARSVYLIEEPLAAAIGAKIPIAQPNGHMILDSGGGTSDVAVISLGGVVVHKSIRVAGDKLEESISSYVRKKFNLMVGEQTAEEIKVSMANAIPASNSTKKMEVKGRDSVSGLPRSVEANEFEINEAIQPVLKALISAIKETFEMTPPELASDIIDKGIVLSGGTTLLRNLDKFITRETGVPAYIAEDPLYCVVRGTGVALENLELYKKSINRNEY